MLYEDEIGCLRTNGITSTGLGEVVENTKELIRLNGIQTRNIEELIGRIKRLEERVVELEGSFTWEPVYVHRG